MTRRPLDPFVDDLLNMLAHGVPAPPIRVPVADDEIVEVPLSLWRRDDLAAILWVERSPGDDELEARVDIFAKTDSWQLQSSGGGSWVGDLDVVLPSDAVAVMGLGSVARSPSSGQSYWLVGGRAGAAVRAIGYRGTFVHGLAPVSRNVGVFFFGVETPPKFEIGAVSASGGPAHELVRTMRGRRSLGLTRQ